MDHLANICCHSYGAPRSGEGGMAWRGTPCHHVPTAQELANSQIVLSCCWKETNQNQHAGALQSRLPIQYKKAGKTEGTMLSTTPVAVMSLTYFIKSESNSPEVERSHHPPQSFVPSLKDRSKTVLTFLFAILL